MYIGFVLLGLYFIYGFYVEIKQILIGKKIIKTKKELGERKLKRMFLRGLVGLILELLILFFFLKAILS